jgi:NAD+ kinase
MYNRSFIFFLFTGNILFMDIQIGIHGKAFSKAQHSFIQGIFDQLNGFGIKVHISEDYLKFIRKTKIHTRHSDVFKRGDDISPLKCLLSIGGDGTFLDSITYIARYDVPILGVNIGRLGFLASTTQENFKHTLENLIAANHEFEYRSLLWVDSNKDIFNGFSFGLNEFAIQKKDTSSMIVVHTYIDGTYLNSYWSDGLIIATPTGSTGYSLSCGGPLSLPLSNNFIVTPISAHNLNVRPMVVSDSSIISLEVEGRSKRFLATLDSRYATIDSTVSISVRKADFKAKLVKLHGYNFFDTLRQKLHWGLDVRN